MRQYSFNQLALHFGGAQLTALFVSFGNPSTILGTIGTEGKMKVTMETIKIIHINSNKVNKNFKKLYVLNKSFSRRLSHCAGFYFLLQKFHFF